MVPNPLVIRVVILVFVLFLLALPVAFWWFANNSLPQREGIIKLSNLHKEVEIISDWRDVPYIKSLSEPDMYRAQGYWTATRRLFQMDMLRRIATGSLSEIFGARCLPQDKLVRQLGFHRVAVEELKKLNPEVKKSLEQYCVGVNSTLDSDQFKNPLECSLLWYKPKPWRPEDTIAVMKYVDYLANESWSLDDLRQKIVDKAGEKVASELFEQKLLRSASNPVRANTICLDNGLEKFSLNKLIASGLLSSPGFGSNGWVVSGTKSDSKGSMLALDRHTSFMDPNLFYACTLSCPKFTVSGVTIPGVPGIMYGRNRFIGWGATALKIDDQDLYVEQFSPEFPNKYKTPEGWGKVKNFVEQIKSRSSLGFGEDNFQYKVQVTRHGPILLSSGNSAVCLNWAGGTSRKPSLEIYWNLNRAKNWDEFKLGLKDYEGAAQTFLFVDKKGSIGLQIAGLIPLRKGSSASAQLKAGQLVPGWTGTNDWVGMVPFDSLPSYFDPEEGFLVANSKRVMDQKLETSKYPIARVTNVLKTQIEKGNKLGLPDMANLQGDESAAIANTVRKTILQAVEKKQIVDKYQLTAVKLLESWDGRLSKDSKAASVYQAFLRTFARRILVPKIGDAYTRQYMAKWPRLTNFLERVLKNRDKNWLPVEERTYDSFVVTSFAQAIADIRMSTESDASNDWSWGNLHKAKFNNLIFHGLGNLSNSLDKFINPPLTSVGGDLDSVSASNLSAYQRRDMFLSNLGPTARLLVDMSDSDKIYETQPIGQSGHFFSSYRLDQLDFWLKNKPLMVPFSDKEAMKQQRQKVVLKP